MFSDDEVEPGEDEIVSSSAEMLATDLAEYLVRKGMPFRETHHISGAAVKLAVDKKVPLDQLTVDDLKSICDKFEDDVAEIWSSRKVRGEQRHGRRDQSQVSSRTVRKVKSVLERNRVVMNGANDDDDESNDGIKRKYTHSLDVLTH